MINSKMKINPKDKRLARIIAVQAIYAYEIYPENSDNVMSVILDNDDEDWSPLESIPSDNAIAYGKKLYKMVIKIKDELDDLIKARSKNWSINRITLLDRLILRMSLAEMIYEDDVPPKVSIAEGVEIAKYFSTDESGSFVNGILDSVYNDIIKDRV
ncbi:MAG: transcription antitermination factor NusB [Candidatus Marinimicrobia bacterium]|nr:transcription antitermination factor NusB [Candidatus Neomarinimicrobiota bacterium]